MGYFLGRARGYGGWGYRSGSRWGKLEAVAEAPSGSIETVMECRNGIDWVSVTRRPRVGPPALLYAGPVVGPDYKASHGRPIRSAVRAALGIDEYKRGCGNCAHAPDGWGSGCNRPDHSAKCGGWRWPKYGSSYNYPQWEPRMPEKKDG